MYTHMVKILTAKGFVMGKKINVYVRDDEEANFVRTAIKQYRVGVDLLRTDRPILSSAQQYMLDTVMNAINNIHGAQQPNVFEPADAPVIKPKVDMDKLFGVIED